MIYGMVPSIPDPPPETEFPAAWIIGYHDFLMGDTSPSQLIINVNAQRTWKEGWREAFDAVVHNMASRRPSAGPLVWKAVQEKNCLMLDQWYKAEGPIEC